MNDSTPPADNLINVLIPGALLVLAVLMAPMAWLAVAMHDSMGALSPHVVILSIARIPGACLVLSLQTGVLLALNLGSMRSWIG